jgi:hypothetical protein
LQILTTLKMKTLNFIDAQNPTALNLHLLPLIDLFNRHNLINRYNQPATFTKALKSAARLYLLFWVNFHLLPTQRLKRLKGVFFCNKEQTATTHNHTNCQPFIVSIQQILNAVNNGFIELKHYNEPATSKQNN